MSDPPALSGPALDLAVALAMEPRPAPVSARELRGPNWKPYSSDERRSSGGWWTADVGLAWADEELVEWEPSRTIEDNPPFALWVAERFRISTVYLPDGVLAVVPDGVDHRAYREGAHERLHWLDMCGGMCVFAETAALAVCRCAVLVSQQQAGGDA